MSSKQMKFDAEAPAGIPGWHQEDEPRRIRDDGTRWSKCRHAEVIRWGPPYPRTA